MSPSLVWIRGGTVLDGRGEHRADVITDAAGTIVEVGQSIVPNAAADQYLEIDAGGCVVTPGLVDLHAHLCQPGFEEAETIETGSRAAALGGFTTVVAMPDTDPAVDSAGVVREVRAHAASALCHVEVAGAITVGRDGRQLAPMGEMASLGVKMFTDADRPVSDDRLMRRAMEYASGLEVTLAVHCDVTSLSAGGHMNEGVWSGRLGLAGIPAEAEELMVMRDLALSRLTGARVHFQHLSTAGSLAMIRGARAQGQQVTADVAPPHFTLTEDRCGGYDAHMKVCPPLRTSDDVAAVKEALADGTVDAIATSHRPQPAHTKDEPFDQAPAGMIGLETALAVATTVLDLPLCHILQLLSHNPARIAGVPAGAIAAGAAADLMVFDPAERWTVDPARGASLSKNTPFARMELTGRVRHTLVAGELVVNDGKATR